jgi:hypothetical protein
MHAANGEEDDDLDDTSSLSMPGKEVFTPDEGSLSDQGFHEEKNDLPVLQVDDGNNNLVGSHCQPNLTGELTNVLPQKPKETEFIKHCMAGVLMRRPNRPDDNLNPNPVVNLNSGQVNSLGNESGTTNSAIRRFDEVFMAEIRSGQQLSQTLNISRADSTDDRSGRIHHLIERGDNIIVRRPRSVSPTLIPRSLKSVKFVILSVSSS